MVLEPSTFTDTHIHIHVYTLFSLRCIWHAVVIKTAEGIIKKEQVLIYERYIVLFHFLVKSLREFPDAALLSYFGNFNIFKMPPYTSGCQISGTRETVNPNKFIL